MDSDEDIDQESKIDGDIDNIWPNKQLTIMNTDNEVNQDDTNADIDHIEWLDHLPYVVQDAVYEYLQEIKRGLSKPSFRKVAKKFGIDHKTLSK